MFFSFRELATIPLLRTSGERDRRTLGSADQGRPADTATGQVQYDNFNGRWGDQKHLDRLMQAYAAEKVKIESRKKGHVVTEQQLADGSIKLTINVGGAA